MIIVVLVIVVANTCTQGLNVCLSSADNPYSTGSLQPCWLKAKRAAQRQRRLVICRGSPSAGHQAGFHPRATGVEQPVAVQLNKMPAQPGNSHHKRKPKHHRGGGGGGCSNPNHYKLCREFADKGHCTAVDCAFAHGKDMLDTRLQQKE